jgi:hypothetical protein
MMPTAAYRDGTWQLVADGGPVALSPFAGAGVVAGQEPFTVTLPPSLAGLRAVYLDPFGERIIDAAIEMRAAAAVDCTLSVRSAAPFAFAGQTACVSGCFPDPASWYGLMLDGSVRLVPAAASRTTVVLSIPPDAAAGRHTIAPAADGEGSVTVGVLQLEGSIDQNMLWRGQSTLMRLRILGTDRPLPLVVTNKTPQIITIEGGEAQTITTPGGADNAVTRSVRGIQKGNFQIDYSLSQPGCGANSELGMRN